jgi:hypothetical protein
VLSNYGDSIEKMGVRFKAIYCALAGVDTGPKTQRSLEFVQQLIHDDPYLEEWLREKGVDSLQADIEAPKSPTRRIVRRLNSSAA